MPRFDAQNTFPLSDLNNNDGRDRQPRRASPDGEPASHTGARDVAQDNTLNDSQRSLASSGPGFVLGSQLVTGEPWRQNYQNYKKYKIWSMEIIHITK